MSKVWRRLGKAFVSGSGFKETAADDDDDDDDDDYDDYYDYDTCNHLLNV